MSNRELREILFRVKRVDNGEWVYGVPIKEALVGSHDGYYPKIIPECDGRHQTVYSTAIEEETVGHYTGLKDKNGTKIFEGDILKISFRKEFLKAVVKFGYYNQPDKILKSHLGFYFDFVDSNSYRKDVGYWTGRTLGEIEVIGNIHDNPELLKGSAKNE